VHRVEELLQARGKRLIGWDEIQEGGLSPSATMMVWRDWKWARMALEHGNDIVMAPTSHTYFDYNQGANPGGPAFDCIGGKLPLSKVLTFEPIPANTAPDRVDHVLGCQGQLWAEYIWSVAKLDYMAWPRGCALAEVAWSPAGTKDAALFQERLQAHLSRLDRLQVNYRTESGAPAQPTQSMERTPRPRGR
jgi:hexosaminidase